MDHTTTHTTHTTPTMGKGKKKGNKNKRQCDRNGGRRAGFGHTSKSEQRRMAAKEEKQEDRFIQSSGAAAAPSTKKKKKKKPYVVKNQLSMNIGRGIPVTRKKAAGTAARLSLGPVDHDLALKTIKALDNIARHCHSNFCEVSDAAGAAASPAAGNKSLSLIEKAREEVLKRAHAMSPGLAEHLQRCERFHQLKENPSRSKPQKCEVCNTRDALEKIGSSHEYLWHCQECLQDPVYVNYYD